MINKFFSSFLCVFLVVTSSHAMQIPSEREKVFKKTKILTITNIESELESLYKQKEIQSVRANICFQEIIIARNRSAQVQQQIQRCNAMYKGMLQFFTEELEPFVSAIYRGEEYALLKKEEGKLLSKKVNTKSLLKKHEQNLSTINKKIERLETFLDLLEPLPNLK